MGALTPPSRKSCYNFRVTEINRVLDGDTIDVTIDLGFDLYKKERVRVAGVDTPESRTSDKVEKLFGKAAGRYVEERLPVGSMQTLVTKKYDSKGKFTATTVKPGHRIIFNQASGDKFNHQDMDYLWLEEHEVMGVLS